MRRIADLLPWLVPFWMAGVVLFYLRHLLAGRWTLRLRRTGVCARSGFMAGTLEVLGAGSGSHGRLGCSNPAWREVPVVMGHLRPVILMPVGLLTGLPAVQIESILLHELAHIRRCDYLVNVLQTWWRACCFITRWFGGSPE